MSLRSVAVLVPIWLLTFVCDVWCCCYCSELTCSFCLPVQLLSQWFEFLIGWTSTLHYNSVYWVIQLARYCTYIPVPIHRSVAILLVFRVIPSTTTLHRFSSAVHIATCNLCFIGTEFNVNVVPVFSLPSSVQIFWQHPWSRDPWCSYISTCISTKVSWNCEMPFYE